SYPEDPALLPPGLEFLALFNDEMFHTEVGMQEKRDVEAFVFAYDTNFLPVVGQQLSLGAHAGPDARARLDLLLEQARVFEPRRACDLVAHDEDRGYLYDPASDSFSSSAGQIGLDLRALLPRKSGRKATLTFTCVPPGEGVRRALDRDLDGVWDTVEEQKGSDPADRSSVPRRRAPLRPAESHDPWWRAWSELRSWLKPVWSEASD
ncbi:MAG TPA: hypothetical protein VFU02_01395, partial [Polyangiaceae bacterium]|nr:hypothetical protein [Polyangiaceae bacterium]